MKRPGVILQVILPYLLVHRSFTMNVNAWLALHSSYRAIINHFTPKIDSWAAVNHLTSMTSEQVLGVIRSNYDTLTLKLQDNLDHYEKYSEKPKEAAFFTQLVRSIVVEVRRTISVSNLEQFSLLQEFATIHWNVFATRPAAANGLDEAISVYIENLRQRDIQTLFNALWLRSGFIRWSLVENKTGV